MQAYVDAVRARIDRMRGPAGPDLDFVLDAAGALTPGPKKSRKVVINAFHDVLET